jgi:hypothetical protein
MVGSLPLVREAATAGPRWGYAEVLTRENRVSDDLYAELAGRLPREELVEFCFAVGLAALINRVHATFQTDLDAKTQASVGDAPFCPIGR